MTGPTMPHALQCFVMLRSASQQGAPPKGSAPTSFTPTTGTRVQIPNSPESTPIGFYCKVQAAVKIPLMMLGPKGWYSCGTIDLVGIPS